MTKEKSNRETQKEKIARLIKELKAERKEYKHVRPVLDKKIIGIASLKLEKLALENENGLLFKLRDDLEAGIDSYEAKELIMKDKIDALLKTKSDAMRENIFHEKTLEKLDSCIEFSLSVLPDNQFSDNKTQIIRTLDELLKIIHLRFELDTKEIMEYLKVKDVE